MSVLIDDSTHASNPGTVNISASKFANYYRIYGIRRFFLYVILILPEFFINWLHKRNNLAFLWIYEKERFLYGCLNPAIILNRQENLVAIFTNLANRGSETYPVIKVYKERLDLLFPIQEFQDGTRLVTASLYKRDIEKPNNWYWADVHPRVLNCLIKDSNLIEARKDSVSIDSWNLLEEGLDQIDVKKEGLYVVDFDDQRVFNAY